jgi:predicted RNase H-like HicB family nuclease
MSYSSADARVSMLRDVVSAADALAAALANLGEAYELLDEDHADALEARVFRPVQAAYARVRHTHSVFAGKHGLPEHRFTAGSPGAQTPDPRVQLERAIASIELADGQIAELQDSMLPVEVGDTEFRAGLSETRSLIAAAPAEGRRLLRTVGR